MSVDDLLAKAGDVERSLSASYYAMFYAASAALETVGVSRAKHSAVIAAFGEQFTKTKRVDARYHSMLLGAFTLRSAADYDTHAALSRETAEETLGNARSFVAVCRSLISRSDERRGLVRSRAAVRGTGRRAGRWFDRGRADHAGEAVKTTFDRKYDVACVEFSSTDSARLTRRTTLVKSGRAPGADVTSSSPS